MTQSIFLNRPFLQLLVAGPLFMASTPLWAGVHFSNEQIIPATSMARETPTIAYTFLLTEKLVPFEVEASLRAGLTKTLNTRDALRAALKEDQPSQRIKGLRNAYDELRQAYLPKLFGLPLKGSAAIARSLLEWDEARLIFDEDELYYRQSMRTFRNCRADCVKPEKPFPEYGDILHGLIEGMPPEDEPRMQVYNLYLRGLLLQESGDEVLAVAVYREAIQIGQSRLIPEIHMRLANLAASIGNFSAAAQEYGAVAFGEYYAQSRVGQAWAYGQNRDCENVLKTAARFRHTVSSEADQKRFGREVLQYETDCAANYLRMSQVVEYDPAGVSIIEQEITALKETRRRAGSRAVVKSDLGICLADALKSHFDVNELSLTLGGTTREPSFTWTGITEHVGSESDIPQPEEVYAANITACMARRLEMLPTVATLSGSITLLVP